VYLAGVFFSTFFIDFYRFRYFLKIFGRGKISSGRDFLKEIDKFIKIIIKVIKIIKINKIHKKSKKFNKKDRKSLKFI